MAKRQQHANDDAALEAGRKEVALKQWRRILKNNPAMAKRAVHRAMGILMSTKAFGPYELARYYAQMINGVATPGEFGISENYGCPKRA